MTPPPSQDVLTRAAAMPDAVLRYADHEDGVVELHLPARALPRPLVVLVHGGFWKQEYDRRHIRPMARALVDAGCVVAAPEYRRVGGRGGWPATGDDLAAALTSLPGLLTGLGVATTTTTVVGHSAGGHLALWLAGLDELDHRCDRVVALAPVADLRAAARERLGDGATQALLGGSPEEVPEAYADADPMRLLDTTPRTAGLVILHGSRDDVVPLSQSRALADRHPHVELRVLDADHFDVIDPTSQVWPQVLVAITGQGDG
ncbi:MAG TPA: alpha/beta hydrolase [Nocardioides sp.]|uniref:alpha/beta hydrolase family protein n=1 Tax=Nocardioides sp. TaxID=35761 RepID=UPI002D7EEB91|nr:alpha/beta hydrolase [Nocardioides sp.]HET6651166.1 alpha/beta hydrolase [Nocardioides sp.]